MIEVECIDPSGYEWLLSKGMRYEVESWRYDTIVIKHPSCGIFGLFANRFKVIGNINLFPSSKHHEIT
jgi:hypothetical protein